MYCDHCGEELASPQSAAHAGCRQARTMEPPRYCAQCRRRMVVQVTPAGWTARCSQHGVLRG